MKIRTVAQYEKALLTIESLMNAFPDGENAANDSKIAELAKAIEATNFSQPICPIYQNVKAAAVSDPAESLMKS